jgi:hypothetical protein
MSVTMNDVVLAILAMDSYNHGYNGGMAVDNLENIAGASIITTSSDLATDNFPTTTSFYAIAYNWNGQTVISYRGTVFGGQFNSGADWGDVFAGWTFGGGTYHIGLQSLEAIVFFQKLAAYDDPSLLPGGGRMLATGVPPTFF